MIVAVRSIHSRDKIVTYRSGNWRVHAVERRDNWVRAWRAGEMYVHRLSGEVDRNDAVKRVLSVAPCQPEPVPEPDRSGHFENSYEENDDQPRDILERLVSSRQLSGSEFLFVSSLVTRELTIDGTTLTLRQLLQSFAATTSTLNGGQRTVVSFESVGPLRLQPVVDELIEESSSPYRRPDCGTSGVVAFRDLRPVYRYVRSLLTARFPNPLLDGSANATRAVQVNLEDRATDYDGRWYLPFDDEGVVREEPLPLIADGRIVGTLSSRRDQTGSTGNGFLDSSGRIRTAVKRLALQAGERTERSVLEMLPRAIIINTIAHVGLTMSGRLDLKIDNALVACRGEVFGAISSLHITCRLADLLGGDRVVTISQPTETRRTPTLFVELPWRASI